MKTKTANYLNKIHNQQSTIEKKKLFESVRKCEAAMDELIKIYLYEKQLLIAIPILLKSASSSELIESLTTLSTYTIEHVKRLETNFPSMSEAIIKNKLN